MAATTTLPELLASLTQSLTSALEATPRIAALERPEDGISLLDVKNELLLSYLQNLVFLILLKVRGSASASTEDGEGEKQEHRLEESVRAKLVELRLYLEKGARPLEEKLRFSIERFLRTAEDARREEKAKKHKRNGDQTNGVTGSESDDSSGSALEDDNEDEQSDDDTQRKSSKPVAAPRLGALLDDVTANTGQRGDGPSGVYRPPKRERQVMETTQRREKAERRPGKSHTMEEFIATELSAAPTAEPSIGTTIVQGGRRSKTETERQGEAERREYEETNFVRLPKESKADRAKKSKQQGAASRSGRMEFGGEEWRGLGEGVDRIDRLTRRKATPGGGGGGVRAMLDKSRKRGPETVDGPRGSGRGAEMGERFQKRLKTMETGRRDRGKGR